MKGVTAAMVARADAIYHNLIVTRDQYCVVCGTPFNLCPSHFWGKLFGGARWVVRWVPENAVAMCPWCHREYESEKGDDENGNPRKFKALMIKRLGRVGFDALAAQAEMIVSKREALEIFVNKVRNMTGERIHEGE